MPDKISCGALRAGDAGKTVELAGWVNRRRDHGGLIFVDLRDREGVTQVVFDPQNAAFAEAEHLRNEDVLRIAGTVRRRPGGTEYRYLDLRRSRMQSNLRVRHQIIKALRDFFDSRGFLEIETPMMIKSTPEGARDYLVPSRLHPGAFYALPQSPQMLKQILMISGFGRYMQIARCMRDEDLRADRQPEFTQLDVELAFCTQEEVLETMESAMRYVWKQVMETDLPPFPRLSHHDAIARYGLDKPDMRFGLELADVGAAFAQSEFAVFRGALDAGGAVVGLRYPGGAALSRRDFDALTEIAKQFGAKGMVWISLGPDGIKSPASKFLNDENVAAVSAALDAENGDALLLFAGERALAYAVAGKMRNEIGDRCDLRDPQRFAFAWVTDFPYLEIDEETGVPAPAHHPFTAPAPGDWDLIDRSPLEMRAQHYDLVLNGYELGSGSIRIHKPAEQRKIFEMLGLTPEQIEERFGFFVRALEYGAPPHGGMALGIDRIAMLACGEASIREVIAFPKNQLGRDLMMDAPSAVPEQLLRDLHVRLAPEARSPE